VYNRGYNRIFFTTQEISGIPSHIEFTNPKLEKLVLPMEYNGDGLYYVDVGFKYFGAYIAKVYQNSNVIATNILRVTNGQFVIYPKEGKFI